MTNLIKNTCLAFFMMLILQACGGRMAHPVMQYNALDKAFSCEHFKAEFGLNEQKFMALSKEEEKRDIDNAAQLILGSPLLLDLSSTIDQEREALETRNAEITRIGLGKNCEPFETSATLTHERAKIEKALAQIRTIDPFPTR